MVVAKHERLAVNTLANCGIGFVSAHLDLIK